MSIKIKVRKCSKTSLCSTLPAQIAKMYNPDEGSEVALEAMGNDSLLLRCR
ncbi:MAG: hypothetical protein ACXQS5_00925 [Candidatus Methanospirareceae archaeon]